MRGNDRIGYGNKAVAFRAAVGGFFDADAQSRTDSRIQNDYVEQGYDRLAGQRRRPHQTTRYRKIKGGDLVLMHPTDATVRALKAILDFYSANGFKVCPVSENIE